MSRLALAAIVILASITGLIRAKAQDFTLPAPTEILREIRRIPHSKSTRPTPVSISYTLPDEQRTPGKLCSAEDPNFQEYRYAEQIPYCQRNVPEEKKHRIAAAYGMPWEQHRDYEFDHRIPLCMGGSNDETNLWPQPLDEAHVKDRLEDELCRRMRAGTLRQRVAVARILAWPDQKWTLKRYNRPL